MGSVGETVPDARLAQNVKNKARAAGVAVPHAVWCQHTNLGKVANGHIKNPSSYAGHREHARGMLERRALFCSQGLRHRCPGLCAGGLWVLVFWVGTGFYLERGFAAHFGHCQASGGAQAFCQGKLGDISTQAWFAGRFAF